MSVPTTPLYANSTRLITETPKSPSSSNIFLFCLTLTLTLVVLVSSVYSLVSLVRIKNRTALSMLVASLCVDDLLCVAPASIFMVKQWTNHLLSQPLCTAAAFLYLFQGVSSNLKASLIIFYNFCTATKPANYETTKIPPKISWAIVSTWLVSLIISALPFCGWGAYSATSWGCLIDCTSSYVLFLFAFYSFCFCVLTVFSVPLTHQLLCSDNQEQLLYFNYRDFAKGYLTPNTPLGSNASSVSPDIPTGKTLNFNEKCVSSEAVYKRSLGDDRHCTGGMRGSRSMTVLYAQKRFSLILALTKVILWLPIMVKACSFILQYTVNKRQCVM